MAKSLRRRVLALRIATAFFLDGNLSEKQHRPPLRGQKMKIRAKRASGIRAVLIALCLYFLTQPLTLATAQAVVIGQINPLILSPGGVSGITFDGKTNPLIIDTFGRFMWRININDAS